MEADIQPNKQFVNNYICTGPLPETGERSLLLDCSSFLVSCICLFLFSGCTMVSTAEWVTFSDSLGQGSEVIPGQGIVNLNGVVEARIKKSDDPEWVAGKELQYPYAGIMMKFWRSGKSIDISQSSGLTIEYILDGQISLRLIQKNVPTGQEYQVTLPSQHLFQAKHIPWELFSQPGWVKSQIPIDLTSLTGIMFTNSSKKSSTAYLAIKEITFTGWENPYGFKGVIKNIGVNLE